MDGDTDSFIVRIWHEAVDRAGNVLSWKGYIEQVGVGICTFRTWT